MANENMEVRVRRNVLEILSNPDIAYTLINDSLENFDEDDTTDEMTRAMEELLTEKLREIADSMRASLPAE
jgi:non-homologous end joining protein Ku